MKYLKNTRILFFILMCALALLTTSGAWAQGETPSEADIIRGAQLYDKWYAVLNVDPPAGNMPIWNRQSTILALAQKPGAVVNVMGGITGVHRERIVPAHITRASRT
jgi:hypothetical protein